MKRTETNKFSLSSVILVIYIVFFISVFFSFRAVSSISIGLLLIAGLVKQKGQVKRAVRHNAAKLLLVGSLVFLLVQFISFLFTDNLAGAWQDIEHKSGLVFIPLAVILTGPFDFRTWKTLILAYCIALLAASVYCLGWAIAIYADNGNGSAFFYHTLVAPIHQHAVYFSIFVFIALVWLLENISKRIYIGGHGGTILVIVFFSGLLFLLSSKLVISFYVLYLLYYMVSLVKKNIFPRSVVVGLLGLVVVVAGIIFLTRNPVRDRFADIIHGNLALVRQDKYTPGDYFNGIQFRLLQWKFVPEILNRHKGWWMGVGPANAQPFLNEEYILKNMYLGNSALGDFLGYRAYNTHNQLLESLLAYGIPGVLSCLFVFFTLIKTTWRKKQRDFGIIVALLLLYAMIESVFETQYGIVLFAFFPSFLCQYQPTRSRLIPI